MKVQFSNTRRMEDLPTMWPTHGKDVDIKMALTGPSEFPFAPGSIKTIYDFGALGYCSPKHIRQTVMNWLRALKSGGSILIVEVDFERVVRQFIGADITLDEYNVQFNRQTNLVKESLAEVFQQIGVPFDNIKQWNGGHKDFFVHPSEFVMEIIKP